MYILKKLPQEIENKVFFMIAEHPVARIIKDSYQPAGETGHGDSFLDKKINIKVVPRIYICKSDGNCEDIDTSWEHVDIRFIDGELVEFVRRRIRYNQFDFYHSNNKDIYYQTYHYYNNLEKLIKMKRKAFGW